MWLSMVIGTVRTPEVYVCDFKYTLKMCMCAIVIGRTNVSLCDFIV